MCWVIPPASPFRGEVSKDLVYRGQRVPWWWQLWTLTRHAVQIAIFNERSVRYRHCPLQPFLISIYNRHQEGSIIISISDWFWVAMTPHHKSFLTISAGSRLMRLPFRQPSFHQYTQIHLVIHRLRSVTGLDIITVFLSFLFSYCYSSSLFLWFLNRFWYFVLYCFSDHLTVKIIAFLIWSRLFLPTCIDLSWSSSNSWF